MMDSKTSHIRSIPVSSKSEFVMSPFLLFSNAKWLQTSAGNRIDHTIGGKWCIPHSPCAECLHVRESYVLQVARHNFVYARWSMGDVTQ